LRAVILGATVWRACVLYAGKEVAPPRSRELIGAGRVDGRAWSETVHVGPWGSWAARPEVGPGGTAVLGWCHDYPLPS
jgi:hypothetical protein